MQAELFELFPTPVMSFSLGRDFTKKEMDFVKSYEGNLHKNMFNWMTEDNDIMIYDPMSNLRAFVTDRMNEYFRYVYKPATECSIYMTQSWINYSYPGEAHHSHFHSNSFLSGCIYIQADKDDEIRFWNRKNMAKWYSIPWTEENKYNGDSWWLRVKTGDVFIWQSDVPHDVPKLSEDRTEPRISLAFNGFLKGKIGSGGFHSILNLEESKRG